MKTNFTDTEISKAIAGGGQAMEAVMRYIYQSGTFSDSVFAFVKNNKGNEQDAEDIFQDGIAHLVMNIRKGRFKGESSVKTYFISICKNLWYNKLRRSANFATIKETLTREEITNHTPEKITLLKEKAENVKALLNQLASPCREILSLWGLSYSMKEIAEKTGYKNEGVIRKKKHQCMQKLMAIVEKNKVQRP